MFEHDGTISQASIMGDYLVSVGSDNQVKLFTIKDEKTLVREIAFEEPVEACCVLNDSLQLAIGQDLVLSVIEP
jgi:hypothetical protein